MPAQQAGDAVFGRAMLAAGLGLAMLSAVAGPAFADSAGTISGVVRDDVGAPAVGVCVQASPATPQPWPSGSLQTASADSSGAYALTLPTGNYDLYVYDCNPGPGSPRWAGTYRGGVDRPGDSPDVAVTSGATAAVDLVAPRGATVSGRVTYDDGTPVAHSCVWVFGHRDSTFVPTAPTRDDGTYEVAGVAPGPRRVQFGNCEGSGASYGTWYRGADSYDTATPIDVTAGSPTAGIDGTVRRYAAMSGRVVDETGQPVAGASMQLQSSSGGGFTGFGAFTDSDGHWRIDHLRPSAYFLYAGHGSPGPTEDLVQRYYPAASDTAGAVPVVVADGVELPGLDMVLPHGARISGRVTDPAGNPLVGACASASPVGPGYNAPAALTDAAGHYTIHGVDKGAYRVEFTRCNAGNWAPQWYGAPPGAPAPVTGLQMDLGQDITGLDGTMQPGATITGRVLNTAGQPLSAICTTAYGGGGQVDAQTDANGAYTLIGLPTSSSYYVFWRDCNQGHYATLYTGGASFAETAERVSLTAGQTTSVPDAVLAVAGSISGTVTDARTGLRAGQVCAYALDPQQQLLGGYGNSDGDGHYRITGLRPGDWVVRFVDCGANVAVPEYWDDTLIFSAATRIAVPEGADRGGVDAAVLLLTVPSVPRLPVATPDASSVLLSWQPPADDGSSTILQYDILNDAGTVMKTVAGTQTSAKIDNLQPGRPYSFAIRATNRKGPGPTTDPVIVTPVTGAPPTSALQLSFTGPGTLVAGTTALLWATSFDANGIRPRTPIQLQGRAAGTSTWTPLFTTTTDDSGGATLARKPTRTTVYRVINESTSAASAAVTVRTTLRIAPSLRATSSPLGHTVPLDIAVGPSQPGQRVVVQVLRGGRWQDLVSCTLGPTGRATAQLRPATRGDWTYRLRTAATTAYAASTSRSIRLHVY